MRIHTRKFCLIFPFILLAIPVYSWKKDEFWNCNQTPFCKRARSHKPNSCSLIAVDVSVSAGDLAAKLVRKITTGEAQGQQSIVPKQNPEDGEEQQEQTSYREEPAKSLILTISAYQDGILRLKIDEDPSLDPPKKRFEVPDVIDSEFPSKKLWVQSFSEEVINGNSKSSSIVYLADV